MSYKNTKTRLNTGKIRQESYWVQYTGHKLSSMNSMISAFFVFLPVTETSNYEKSKQGNG